MKILVLGGTVYLSKAIAALARDRGHDVTVAARGSSGDPPVGVRFVAVDRDRPGDVTGLAAEYFDAVIDVARLPGHVRYALDALADRTGHWTFVSTASVYADHATPGQTAADAPLLAAAPADSLDTDPAQYGPNKVACERLVRDRGGDAFIVRAGLIVGPDDPTDRFGYWPHRIADGGEVLAPGDPAEPIQYIDVADLAAWILAASETATVGIFDAICPPISRGSFLAQIAAALDRHDAKFTWVPQDVLLEQGVRPWSGPESLGLWLPVPEYAGFLSRDPSASVAAGMRNRPVTETARTWHDWSASRTEPPPLAAGLSRGKEAEILATWHGRR